MATILQQIVKQTLRAAPGALTKSPALMGREATSCMASTIQMARCSSSLSSNLQGAKASLEGKNEAFNTYIQYLSPEQQKKKFEILRRIIEEQRAAREEARKAKESGYKDVPTLKHPPVILCENHDDYIHTHTLRATLPLFKKQGYRSLCLEWDQSNTLESLPNHWYKLAVNAQKHGLSYTGVDANSGSWREEENAYTFQLIHGYLIEERDDIIAGNLANQIKLTEGGTTAIIGRGHSIGIEERLYDHLGKQAEHCLFIGIRRFGEPTFTIDCSEMHDIVYNPREFLVEVNMASRVEEIIQKKREASPQLSETTAEPLASRAKEPQRG